MQGKEGGGGGGNSGLKGECHVNVLTILSHQLRSKAIDCVCFGWNPIK